MTRLELASRLGGPLGIDVCTACHVIWFDRYEDLQISPAGTLELFAVISDHAGPTANSLSSILRCPRCQSRLSSTHDLQRATAFQYWRCDAEHGRLMTFIDFLREKDFVRPLTPQQLDELRQGVRTVNCSNCGAAIDLAKDSVCGHCGSAVSMLDPQQMARVVGQLRAAAAGGRPREDPAPAVARIGTSEGHSVDIGALMRALNTEDRAASRPNLIEAGIGLLGDLLRKRL
jgi:DNA-directed RNA polymerase subunit RPC12/RpoP